MQEKVIWDHWGDLWALIVYQKTLIYFKNSKISWYIEQQRLIINVMTHTTTVYTACTLLVSDKDHLDPHDYGWEESHGIMLPIKSLNPLPAHMLKVCGCRGRCDRKTCKCSLASVPCTVFCHGKSLNVNCMNTIKHSWQV